MAVAIRSMFNAQATVASARRMVSSRLPSTARHRCTAARRLGSCPCPPKAGTSSSCIMDTATVVPSGRVNGCSTVAAGSNGNSHGASATARGPSRRCSRRVGGRAHPRDTRRDDRIDHRWRHPSVHAAMNDTHPRHAQRHTDRARHADGVRVGRRLLGDGRRRRAVDRPLSTRRSSRSTRTARAQPQRPAA